MSARLPIPSEYIDELKEHPYVVKATKWSIRFSSEFKRTAYAEYCSGKSIREIFKNAGLDTEKLGNKRLENFRNSIVQKAESEAGFEDQRKKNCRKEAQSTEAQMAKRIRELEHRNAYLEQENEFLKKIQMVEKVYGGKVDGAK